MKCYNYFAMSIQQNKKELKAVYNALTTDIEEENLSKPKESIVLFLSALSGKSIYYYSV